MIDEVLGIAPGPQKLETLLDAMEKARTFICDADKAFNLSLIDYFDKRDRQHAAFRARILRMFEEQRRQIEEWETYHGFYMGDMEFIETMSDKDKRIAELEQKNDLYLSIVHGSTDWREDD